MMLYFVRHGETDWNAAQRLQGQRDIPLNDKGRVQAVESASLIQSRVKNFEDLDYWASPLLRTAETMERLRDGLSLYPQAYKKDDHLKELNFGAWEGCTLPEARVLHPEIMLAREKDKWFTNPPLGESYEEVANRVSLWLKKLERDTLVVSHGGVGRVLMHLVAGLPKREASDIFIKQGVVYAIKSQHFELWE